MSAPGGNGGHGRRGRKAGPAWASQPTPHFEVTLTALALLCFRRPHLYARARTSLVLASYTAAVACRRAEPPL